MAFDLASAKPVNTGFDLASARPINDEPQKSVSQFAKNAAKSFYQQTLGIVAEPIKEAIKQKSLKPIGRTVAAPFQLAGGVVEKALPDKIFGRSSLEDMPEAVVANYKQAYGGGKNIVNTLYEDPFRVATDISLLTGLPGGVIKAAQASKIAKVAKIANLPKIAKAANIALKVSEATNPLSMALKGTGKTVEIGGKVISKTADKSAYKMIDSLIKPKTRDFAYGKDPVAGVLNEGIVAKSVEDLGKKVSQAKTTVGQKIETLISNKKFAERVADYNDMLKPIDEALIRLNKNPRTNSAAIERLYNAKLDLLGAETNATGQTIFTKNISKLKAKDAMQLKRDLGDMAKWTANASDDKLVNTALKAAYRAIDQKLDNLIPGIKFLNERYANLLGADMAIKNRAIVMGRSNIVSLPEILTGLGVGIGTGQGIKGLLAAGAYRSLSSTPAKTAMAKGLKLAVATPASKLSLLGPKISSLGKYQTYAPNLYKK